MVGQTLELGGDGSRVLPAGSDHRSRAGNLGADRIPGRARAYCFTWNNPNDDVPEILEKIDVKYLVYGEEYAPSTSTKHYQGYIYFVNPRAFQCVQRLLRPAHVEIARGSPEANITYCKKDGRFVERGTPPLSQKEKGSLEVNKWRTIVDAAASNNLDAINENTPDVYVRYYGTLKRIATDNVCTPNRLHSLDNFWYTGPPGTGKSWTARDKYPDHFIKNANKWWCGYAGQETVIMDEIELEHGKFLGHFLKIWGDIYPFNGEIKGAGRVIRPRRLVVCSNYTIEEVFAQDSNLIAAIRRRFQVIRFYDTFLGMHDD